MRHKIFQAVLLGAGLVLWGAGVARAQDWRQQWRWCAGQDKVAPDAQIASCTLIIESGRETSKNLAIAYYDRGNVYDDQRQYDRAIADYDQSIRLNPSNAKVLSNRGSTYRAKGQFERAIADYDQAIRLDPSDAMAFNNRGNSYLILGQYDRAITDYDQAIRLDPSHAQTFNNRGTAYRAKAQYDRAIVDFDQAIRLNPAYANALNSRCLTRASAGRDLQVAMADCNEALRLRPGNGITLKSRAVVWFKLGKFAPAIDDYSGAIAQNPRDADSLFGRGLARLKAGDTAGGEADIAAATAIRGDVETTAAQYGLKR